MRDWAEGFTYYMKTGGKGFEKIEATSTVKSAKTWLSKVQATYNVKATGKGFCNVRATCNVKVKKQDSAGFGLDAMWNRNVKETRFRKAYAM